MRKTIGIFGGTFNPVHLGHLRLALELKQQLALDELRLLPCHQPPHRAQPLVSSAQRVDMLRLALEGCTELLVDTRELARDKPSYTYDTLHELRAELGPDTSLCFCMGVDSFAGLDSWHHWQGLLGFTHLVVVSRPGWELPTAGPVAELLRNHQQDAAMLSARAAGAVVLLTPRLLPISSTEIRALIKAGQSPQYLLPDSVWHYIRAHGLYG